MKLLTTLDEAWHLLGIGKIIAYPTEAVYGLGCDPFNQKAVENLLALKQRPETKGLIILISDWAQLDALIAPISDASLIPVRASWPGPTTWVFPKSSLVPQWVSGAFDSIAIRMSAHPLANQLSQRGPVISTSANISGLDPAKDVNQLFSQFPSGIDAVLQGELGTQLSPCAIYDVQTGICLRH